MICLCMYAFTQISKIPATNFNVIAIIIFRFMIHCSFKTVMKLHFSHPYIAFLNKLSERKRDYHSWQCLDSVKCFAQTEASPFC